MDPSGDAFPDRYTEDVEASHWIREEQFAQIERYLNALAYISSQNRCAFYAPDYSSLDAYRISTERLRAALRDRIGYPPPGFKDSCTPRVEFVAEDGYACIYRVWCEVLEGVDVYGLLMVPHGLEDRAPLMICQHGGGGSPEIITALTKGGTFNYGWVVQRALREGFVTWSPGLVFPIGGTEKIPGPTRVELDRMARYVGTSILAIELWKITCGLGAILNRPEVDGSRVAMIGLSYGGLYTQFAAALNAEISVAVSSSFFNDRRVYAREDWCLHNYLNEFTDPEICGLICPRPLMIEVGIRDELFGIQGARSQVMRASTHWERLGLGDRFVYVESAGGHEFCGEKVFDFVKRFIDSKT